MFDYLRGRVSFLTPDRVVLDVGGVGFSLAASANTTAKVRVGDEATLYTYLAVREDSLDLFGFSDREEQSSFLMLTSVSGVGPKAALAILSALTPSALALAIVSGDEKALCAAQGVGKRLASRVLLELKDKVSNEAAISGISSAPASAPVKGVDEAAEALVALGYSASEVYAALAKVDASLPTEERVRLGLRALL
ncbi:MAG: Holliday junction branch migration protein RuvA [Oscillospiraceae bacterium]|nr:Holliday junction branch migration protein RuvA [Oscillospiraceae bacterium]